MRPRISVICPTYNRSTRILRTLESVRAQSVHDWELLVLSDGSTDDTVDVVRGLAREDARIAVHELPRTGHPSGPRAEGLRRSAAPIVAYLDHDDAWRDDHLARLAELLEDGPGADLAVTGFVVEDGRGRELRRSRTADLWWHPEIQTVDPRFEPSRVGHRRGVVERVGGWRVTAGLEDWDVWFRLARAGCRVRTTTARTARILEEPSTRRHGVPPLTFLPLLAGPNARALQRCLALVCAPEWVARMLAAGERDDVARLARLADAGGLVTPVASADALDADAPDAEPPGPVRGPGGPALRLMARDRGYVVGLPVFCSTTEHADAVRALMPQHAHEQLLVLRRLVEEAGVADVVDVPLLAADDRDDRPAKN